MNLITSLFRKMIPKPEVDSKLLSYKQRHKGDRCFIMGNSPSVKCIDLRDLSDQYVFSISNGYLHKNFSSLRKVYHVIPQITYGLVTPEIVTDWFKEIDDNLGRADIFVSDSERFLIEENCLFTNRLVNYLKLSEEFTDFNGGIPDLTRPIPRVESAPIMALMLGMYMGFTEIILIGIDHDHFRTNKYEYAFEPTVLKNLDLNVDEEKQIVTPLYETFHSLARLWGQYRAIKEIANESGTKIYNGSIDSALDEFEKIPFKQLSSARKSV